MRYKIFKSLILDAKEFSDFDQYLAECGGAVDDPINALKFIWDFSHAPEVKTIRAAAGMSQMEFSCEYGIPRRTLECWESQTRETTTSALETLAFAVLSDMLDVE